MIGKRIQELRQQNGWSLSELAERTLIAKSYLSNIERNINKNPSIQVLEKLSLVFGVSISDILHNNSDKPILDSEWLELVREAMNSGISKDQFREFLEFNRWRMMNK